MDNPAGSSQAESVSLEMVTIPELFKGKCVLVTGATGFLGKVLVEKLLRSCPGIKELYILVRPSKKNVPYRLQDYTQNQVFHRLRSERPDAINKIRPLMGDIALENLGLTGWHLRKVIEDISFVFHCAANVRFEDDVRDTLSANLLGVHNILNICRSCCRLQGLVHVSTAYSFCNRGIISEKVYQERVKPEHIVDSIKWMSDDQLLPLCMHYMQDRPAFYHFSKALAESLIVQSQINFPAIIVRPSIITAAVKEPFPGWIDNYNGPSGFISVCGKGIVRTLLVDPEVNADWVPVDIVANTLIVAAHYLAVNSLNAMPDRKLKATGCVPIVNCTCPENNLITWRNIVKICLPFLEKYPSATVFGKPGGTVTSSPLHYCICRFISHYIPAMILDGLSCVTFRKPRMISLYRKIHRVMGYLEYYTTRSFIFHSHNMQMLVEQMGPEDREMFPIDQRTLDWSQYMESYVLGVRRYFLKEVDCTLPSARSRMMRIHYAWSVLKISSWIGIGFLLQSLQKRGYLNRSFVYVLSLK